jgi:uridylate kinase
MQRIAVTALAALAFGLTAQAGDVFVTRDAQGNPVFTDRPESLPAQKVGVATRHTDAAAAPPRSEPATSSYAADDKARADAARLAAESREAAASTAADKAKRCEEARAHYMTVMTSQRLYEQGPNEGERRYLDSAEIDATRANAKSVMDEFCAGQ